VKRDNDQSLGDAIRQFLRTYHLEDKMNETRLIRSWGKVVGKMVDTHTKGLQIRNKVLYVKLDSPALRTELGYAREKLITALNKEAGEVVIAEIVFN
jgi:predicted nucleic acid-binding Zn ribbon protein